MKSHRKITVVIFLFSLFAGTFFLTFQHLPTKTQGQLCTLTECSVYSMEFIDAYYLDADNDGYADDTRFYVLCYFCQDVFVGRLSKVNCEFEIILPSGTTYSYKGFMLIYSKPKVIVQFDVYNTISESGWYTINFYSTVQVKNILYDCFCSTTFDPPTGHGEGGGTPTISL